MNTLFAQLTIHYFLDARTQRILLSLVLLVALISGKCDIETCGTERTDEASTGSL